MLIKFNKVNNNDGISNYGDCITIYDGNELFVYDCGSDEQADNVINQLKENGLSKIKVVLSHTDSDHVNGVYKLCKMGLVDKIYTFYPLNHIEEIYNRMNGKILKDTIKNRINKTFENIINLPKKLIIDSLNSPYLSPNVRFVGPSKEYILDNVAKLFDCDESNTENGETIVNAISQQLEIKDNNNKFLLTGDSCFETLKSIVNGYNHIQLPHHGKEEIATQIFAAVDNDEDITYYISDNTGKTNGGSDMRSYKGKNVKNTRTDDTVECNLSNVKSTVIGSYGYPHEMHIIK